MCWTTLNEPNRLKAKEDIIVYKLVRVIDGNITSYYQSFEYKINNLYQISSIEPLWEYSTPAAEKFGIKDWYICSGFHSYINNIEIADLDGEMIAYVENHADELYWEFPEQIYGMKCIIPKGAEYYVNEKDDVVSDKLIPIALSTKCLQDAKTEEFEYE